MLTRTQIQIKGIVQGVGFRPFVFALASENALKGRVLNNAVGVLVDVEGENEGIERFISELRENAPPLAKIDSIESKNYSKQLNYSDFRIVESAAIGEKFMPISADVATCADCLREMFDPNNRSYRYPFINCTNCGPRFTIIENVPYDRSATTMREFEMCAECRSEYENPLNRRFHAEPTACANCGPEVFLLSSEFEPQRREDAKENKSAIEQARRLLQNGKILAVKGIGGFHLVCDALNDKAVKALRKRKFREDKPFALMANSVEMIEKYCFVSEAEKDLLLSKERPIVLLEKKRGAKIPELVAPNVDSLGFMLPYAPLHFLLLETGDAPLVMTSANISDEPICYEDFDAKERLKNIADYFLLHNRRIHIRTDDSIVRIMENGKYEKSKIKSPKSKIVIRRSRGYAPAPVKTSFAFKKQILACGAELKNTFCLAKDSYAFLSHHIGDLENLETLKSFTTGIEHYKNLFNLQPEIVAHDLHPEYLSTKYALGLDAAKIGIQHHHAHIASCLADNAAEGEVIGAAFDGLGFGTDGKLWGGEFFVADFGRAERVAHLEYAPMPGGAKAISEPWRMAAVYLEKTFGDDFLNLEIPFVENLNKQAWATLRQMIRTKTNCPETSSAGRLFDAAASLLNLRNTVNYEGQAAIELEAIAEPGCAESYEFGIERNIIKTDTIIRAIVEDLLEKVSPSKISAKFHNGAAQMIARTARNVRRERKLNRVALSGGVFQNKLLLETTCRILRRDGFEVLTHSRVPTNDGGIALGQAAIANAHITAGRI
ncbi:carbamoyltransferase HypF [soil metagenome]